MDFQPINWVSPKPRTESLTLFPMQRSVETNNKHDVSRAEPAVSVPELGAPKKPTSIRNEIVKWGSCFQRESKSKIIL